jgi:fatty-acyl-CoA synthase
MVDILSREAMMDPITIGELLHRTAAQHPDSTFFFGDDRDIKFADFDRHVDRMAAGLLRLGLRKGDHIAVWLPNTYEWILTFCAAARIGAVIVPVNTRYQPEEAQYIIAQSDAKLLIMPHKMWQIDYHEMLVSLEPGLRDAHWGLQPLRTFPNLKSIVVVDEVELPGILTLSELISDDIERLADEAATVKPADPLLICYTSGTTGKPKGVMHSHGVIRQSTKVGLALGLEPDGVIMAHMPFYHSAGLFMALVPALSIGAGLVPMAHWNASNALRLIEKYRVTAFGGIPTHFYDMVNAPEVNDIDMSSVRAAWIGGSAVMRDTFERIMRTLKLPRLLSTYGMTENTISTSFNVWDDPIETCCQNKAPILADCEVRIVNPETFETAPTGQDGEVWCRGETVMVGYYKDPVATSQAITPDGWLRSGDIGNLDSAGYLTITGRLKEMLKVGGTNTSPVEIEQHLASHPAVKSSAVVGVPDERLGQVPCAYIEVVNGATVDAQDIIAYCKSRMANYKVPRYVKFVDELPRTATGKVQRGLLAKWAEGEFA